MSIKTADLCDQHGAEIQVAEPILQSFGGMRAFGGPISTLRVYEDNVLVRAAVEEAGDGRVLVVDGGGSLRCALVGGLLASLAQRSGWAGIVVYGAIRDAQEIGQLPLGLLALNTCPRRSAKLGAGERDVTVSFAGLTFQPGHYLYVDEDGVVIAGRNLLE